MQSLHCQAVQAESALSGRILADQAVQALSGRILADQAVQALSGRILADQAVQALSGSSGKVCTVQHLQAVQAVKAEPAMSGSLDNVGARIRTKVSRLQVVKKKLKKIKKN